MVEYLQHAANSCNQRQDISVINLWKGNHLPVQAMAPSAVTLLKIKRTEVRPKKTRTAEGAARGSKKQRPEGGGMRSLFLYGWNLWEVPSVFTLPDLTLSRLGHFFLAVND